MIHVRSSMLGAGILFGKFCRLSCFSDFFGSSANWGVELLLFNYVFDGSWTREDNIWMKSRSCKKKNQVKKDRGYLEPHFSWSFSRGLYVHDPQRTRVPTLIFFYKFLTIANYTWWKITIYSETSNDDQWVDTIGKSFYDSRDSATVCSGYLQFCLGGLFFGLL